MAIMKEQTCNPGKVGDSSPAIAIIGCGAIVERFYLPVLAKHPNILERLILVDADGDKARRLAERYKILRVANDHQDILPSIDGAVVAVPHHLHYSISLDCIRNGIHVLCEKPLAETKAQVQEIISEAEKVGVNVSVNNNRRLFPSSKIVHEHVREGKIGQLLQVEFQEGQEYDWPTATGFYFGSGKGVLFDKGAHVLDLICWWLGENPRLMSYEDDSHGGSEAVAKVTLAAGDCQARVHLSWLSKLSNSFRVQGELACIEGRVDDWRCVRIVSRAGKNWEIRANSGFRNLDEINEMVVTNFIDVIVKKAQPVVCPQDVADSIALIEECYRRRSRLAMPWHDTFRRVAS